MRWTAALLGLLLLAAGTVVSSAADADRLEWTVRYNNRNIRVYVFTPPGKAGPWPLVLVLHGASGIGRGHMIWPLAQEIAKHGVAAAVVHYYDGLPPRTKRKQSVHLFAEREKILDRVIGNLLSRKQVKGKLLGVVGYSLGGFHAIGLAATDRRIAASVSLAGGLSGHIPAIAANQAAPLMLIHGTRDRIVPYRRSLIARAAWRQAGQPATLVQLRNVGHVPYGASRAQAFAAAADFASEKLLGSLRTPIPRPRLRITAPDSLLPRARP